MKKRLMTVILATATALVLGACGFAIPVNGDGEQPEVTEEPVSTPTDASWDGDPDTDRNYVAPGDYMVFELPEGWDEDSNWHEGHGEYCYAPGGDSSFAESVITVKREFVGYDARGMEDLMQSQSALDQIRDSFATKLETAEELATLKLEDYGNTVLGACLKVSYQMNMHEDYCVYNEVYYMSDNGYMYVLHLLYSSDAAVENPTGIVENILATAEVR